MIMRAFPLLVLLAFPCVALAAPRKPKAAVAAVPASPSKPSDAPKPAGTLIDSDIGGRDLVFLANAIDVGSALRFLAEQTSRTSNPDLRGFGADLVKTLAAQSVVLNTVAEMRKIRIPEGQSETLRRIAARVGSLEGIRLDKALLDAFREVDRRAVATYELGVTSQDTTIRKLCEQTLPQMREHLSVVQTMTGIAPKREAGETPSGEKASPRPAAVPPPVAAPAARPGFRTNVRLPGDPAPATGR
jgi:hypothetical protein